MSFKRQGAATYSYDFQLNKRRYTGETTATSQREGDRLEQEAKVKARQEQADETKRAAEIGRTGNVDLTLEAAFSRYFREKGHHAENAGQIEQGLGLILTYFANRDVTPENPRVTTLLDITQAEVAKLVAWRRTHTRWDRPGEKLISASQVNRSTTEVLRRVYVYARDTWEIEKLPRITFGGRLGKSGLLLAEPRRRKRTLHDGEDIAIGAAMIPEFEIVRQFLLVSCLRITEALVRWDQIDMSRNVAIVTVKGGHQLERSLTPAAMEILRAVRGEDREYAFTYIAQRTVRPHICQGIQLPGTIKGRRYPITRKNFEAEWFKVRAKVGISGLTIHDHRRTGVAQIAASQGIEMGQVAAGHADIKTTQLYLGNYEARYVDAATVAQKERKERIDKLRAGGADVVPIKRFK